MNVEEDLAALQEMTTDELRERHAEIFGEEHRSRHKAYLIRKIAWRIQAEAEGDLSERARRRAAKLAVDAEVRTTPPRTRSERSAKKSRTSKRVEVPRDPRLPAPGTAITRKYKGRTLHVRVQRDGFEYEGERYKTLSAVAKAITGSHCNGFRFFKLAEEK